MLGLEFGILVGLIRTLSRFLAGLLPVSPRPCSVTGGRLKGLPQGSLSWIVGSWKVRWAWCQGS